VALSALTELRGVPPVVVLPCWNGPEPGHDVGFKSGSIAAFISAQEAQHVQEDTGTNRRFAAV
jgi:hypothetical protein